MPTPHTHTAARTNGPYGCAGGVAYVQTCACGCKRRSCSCAQCEEQGTDDSGWFMPVCKACKLRHPEDEACR